MTDFTRLPDVASRALGGSVVYATDEFYGGSEHLISPSLPSHDPAAFNLRGKVYDGWESRRRRTPGDDFAIVRLAAPAIVRGVSVDTSFFAGNYPPAVSLDGTTVLGYPRAEDLLAAEWTPLIPRTAVEGDSPNVLAVEANDRLVTHVRITMHPDGGIARLRLYGEIVPDPRCLGGRVDLAATVHGGRITGCSNWFYSSPANILGPGRARVMSDGWETARRRDDSNDWVTVALAADAVLHEVVVDTTCFVGNAPAAARLTSIESGAELLPMVALVPDTEHRFRIRSAEPVRAARLDIHPDGGISRLRLVGTIVPDAQKAVSDRWLTLLGREAAAVIDRGEFFE